MSAPKPEGNPVVGCGCLGIFLFFMFSVCCSGPSNTQSAQSAPRQPGASDGVRKIDDSNANSDGIRNNSTRPVGTDPALQKEGDIKVVGQHMDANGNLIIEVDTVQQR